MHSQHFPPAVRDATVAQWVGALALEAEGWVFESRPRQTKVVKTGSDIFTAKRLAICESVTGPSMPRVTVGVTLLYGHECWAKVKICSPSPVMVTSPYEWKFSSVTINPRQSSGPKSTKALKGHVSLKGHEGFQKKIAKVNFELCNPFPRIENPYSLIINWFPRIR